MRQPSSSPPSRAFLERQIDELEAGATSQQSVADAALGGSGRWWNSCAEALADDPQWLFTERTESVWQLLRTTASDRAASVDSAFSVARALADPARNPWEIDAIARIWEQSGLLPALPISSLLPASATDGLDDPRAQRILRLLDAVRPAVGEQVRASDAAQAMVMISALLLAGASKPRRPTVRVSVVFDHGDGTGRGAAGFLELYELPHGPPGLFPDPRTMADVRGVGLAFAESLTRAWNSTRRRAHGRCALWRLSLADSPAVIPPLEGGSLGAAFALGLRDLFSYPSPRRPTPATLRRLFHGLRPRTAVTGALDQDHRLGQVTGMRAKLEVAQQRNWRLVAPEANRSDITQAPVPQQVKFAATIEQADRYARQWRTGRLAVAAVVAVAMTGTGLFVSHRDSVAAYKQQTADHLADLSGSLLGINLPEAQLMAVEAYQLEQDPQTLAALFQAVTASPSLVRYLQAGAPVSAMYGAADGKSVTAGTSRGQVLRWDVATGARTTIATVDGPVTAVGSDADGTVTAAASASELVTWTAAGGAERVALPLAGSVDAVAVSPSGRYVAVASQGQATAVVTLYDRMTNTARRTAVTLTPFAMAMPNDDRLILAAGGGPWQTFSLPLLKNVLGPTTLSTGVHQVVEALSPGGRYTGFSNGGADIEAWDTSRDATLGTAPDRFGLSHGSHPQALGISADGKRVAVVDGSAVYVSDTSHAAGVITSQTALPGTDSTSAVQFIGGDDHLVSASGSALAIWDLRQSSRIGSQVRALAPSSCNACPAPQTAVSPDGKMMATLAGNRAAGSTTAIYLHALAPGGPQYTISSDSISESYELLGWGPGSAKVFVVKENSAGQDILQAVQAGNGLQVTEQQDITEPGYGPLAYSPVTGRLVALSDSGGARIASPAVPGKSVDIPSPEPIADSLLSASVDPSLSFLAEAFQAGTGPFVYHVRVTDLRTGGSREVGSGRVLSLYFSGPDLFIQRANGQLEVWNTSGTALLYRFQREPNATGTSAIVAGSLLVQQSSDGTLAVTQASSGRLLGLLPLPGSAAGRARTGLALDGPDELVSTTEGVSLGGEGTFVRWDLSSQSWMRTACLTAGRGMTAADWQRYIGGAMPGLLACGS